jgi:hypothetical protein
VGAHLERDDVYTKPVRVVTLPTDRHPGRLLGAILQIEGPEAPVDVEVQRRLTELGGEATAGRRTESLEPLLAAEFIRRLGARDLPNERGTPLRQRVLRTATRDGLSLRIPRQVGPAFTDMSQVELARVVNEAEGLVVGFWQAPEDPWPLLPAEVARIRRPPPIRHRPWDYDERLEDGLEFPDDVLIMRSAKVLAHDLTLLRLGRDPDDPKARVVLRVELQRARRRRSTRGGQPS